MDRNEQFRKRLEKQMSKPTKRDLPLRTTNFDPTPYADLIMDIFAHDADEMQSFMLTMTENPKLSTILGKTSVLSAAQKSKVMFEFTRRVMVFQDFDPTPFVDELVDLYDKKEFEQFKKVDKDGSTKFDFSAYFKQHDFTKEQISLINEQFLNRQSERTISNRKKLFLPSLIVLVMIVVPPFFIPNLLQKLGLLPSDAGWFLKIVVGLISVFMLYQIAVRAFAKYVDYRLKRAGKAYFY